MTENEIAKKILDAAFVAHTKLGPGLLESVYEVVLAHEPHLKNGIKRIINGKLDDENSSEISL